MNEDEEIVSTRQNNRLVAYWLMLTGLLTNRNKKNLADIMSFLETDISVIVRPGTLLFIDIRWFELHKTFFSTSVMIAFTLTKDRPARKQLTELGRKNPATKNRFNYEIHPGTSDVGEQLFYFSFSDFEKIASNKMNLDKFITNEYQTEEEIRAENKFYWDELKEFDRSRKTGDEE